MSLSRIPDNPVLNTDVYKFTHWLFNHPDVAAFFSYLEARYGRYAVNRFFGLQYILKENFQTPITADHLDEAREFHRDIFGTEKYLNVAGFEHIIGEYDGYWPVHIRAVPEGMLSPQGNVAMTIRSTDRKVPWAAQYVETELLQVWFPTQVCTKSYYFQQLWTPRLERTGTPALRPYKVHDFGYRGSSCREAAGLAGAAHLVNFDGTDNTIASRLVKAYYGGKHYGASVPAAEHGNVLTWGKAREQQFFQHCIMQLRNGPAVAYSIICDTYDVYHAVGQMLGKALKAEIVQGTSTLVVRPDSGDPPVVVRRLAESLQSDFGSTPNTKGYEVLNNTAIIQGDGIDLDSSAAILDALELRRFSADNLVTGCGSALVQEHKRDDGGWAIKPSAMQYVGSDEWIAVQKTPKDDNRKRSKEGVLKLVIGPNGVPQTVTADHPGNDLLEDVYHNGTVLREQTFDDIRSRA